MLPGMSRETRARGFWRLAVAAAVTALGVRFAAACNDTALVPLPDCHPNNCTCDQDPFQPLCKGFNDKPEAGAPIPFAEAGSDSAVDASDANEGVDASDAAVDADEDAGD
jgi:hypothetical protein